jgi:CheY-like chemotaxis protein
MILVVDDTIEVAQLLVEVCTTTGYYADFALHGEAALYKMERIYYSLAFIDIILPGLDGSQIAERVKALPEPHCRIPLVAMTGSSDSAVVDSKLFVHRMQKPFLPRHVRVIIEKYANPPIPDLHLSLDARMPLIKPVC